MLTYLMCNLRYYKYNHAPEIEHSIIFLLGHQTMFWFIVEHISWIGVIKYFTLEKSSCELLLT